jgi:hypothetical protein
MTLDRLPRFDLREYAGVLEAALEVGYDFRPIAEMPLPVTKRTLYLRHDIDFHLYRVDEMAKVDADAGVQSTFYLLLTGYYNPLLPETREVIDTIVNLGHEVGLHYDLREYPANPEAALEKLHYEMDLVERITGKPVRTISMHEPSAGHTDLFLSVDGYVHPHDPRWGDILYISDSCRAWRDYKLLRALGPDGPERLHLNLHAELWLDGSIDDRLGYLEIVTAKMSAEYANRYFRDRQSMIWRMHEAVLLDTSRRAAESDCGEETPTP